MIYNPVDSVTSMWHMAVGIQTNKKGFAFEFKKDICVGVYVNMTPLNGPKNMVLLRPLAADGVKYKARSTAGVGRSHGIRSF